jgi:UDP-N-acetylglucosamine acyltransferase
MCGLNVVGLRRANFSAQDRMELKQLYRSLFRGGKNLGEALGEARKKFVSAPARVMLEFLAHAKRGVCADVGDMSSDNE